MDVIEVTKARIFDYMMLCTYKVYKLSTNKIM